MDKELTRKIAAQQTARFFYSYPDNWRRYQIMMVEKNLRERFEVYPEFIQRSNTLEEGSTVDGVIAQEITNGLYFEGIAIALQAIEDLFALLHAGKRPLRFISDIITYSVGKVKNLITQKFNDRDIADLFFYPLFEDEFEPEQQAQFDLAFRLLADSVGELKSFYIKYEFFYNQYKHGLCVVSRAYGNYSGEQIERNRGDWQTRHLLVFDNLSVSKLDKDDVRVNKKIMMPYLTPEIKGNLQALLQDDNLIRFVSQDERVTINELMAVVAKASMAVSVFMHNIVNTLKGEYPITLYLPRGINNEWLIADFQEDLHKMAINKKIHL
jgi:hypothetical protein